MGWYVRSNLKRPIPARVLADEDGLTLIEVIIAALIGTVIFLGSTTLTSLSVKSNRTAEQNISKHEVVTQVRQALSVTNACTTILQNQAIDGVGYQERPVTLYTTLADPSSPTGLKRGDPIKTSDQQFENPKFTIVPYSKLQADVWLARINFTAVRKGEHMGTKDLIGEASALVRTNAAGTSIVECIPLEGMDLASDGDNILNQKICVLASNGEMKYDPATKMCISAIECFPGTKDSASCPAGKIITSCKGSGTIDPLKDSGVGRAFPNGIIKPPSDTLCDLDRPNNKGTCLYALDTNSAGAVCNACCKPDYSVVTTGAL